MIKFYLQLVRSNIKINCILFIIMCYFPSLKNADHSLLHIGAIYLFSVAYIHILDYSLLHVISSLVDAPHASFLFQIYTNVTTVQ